MEPQNPQNHRVDIDPGPDGIIENTPSTIFLAEFPRKNKPHLAGKYNPTPPETNIAPENRPSQKETSIPTIHFQVLC